MFFLNYGFISDSAPFEVLLILEVADDDPLLEVKSGLLGNTCAYPQIFNIYSNLENESKLEDAISFARFVVFDKNEDESLLNKAKSKFVPQNEKDTFKGHLPPISKVNEMKAWELIGKTSEEYLDKYPTTVAKDNELLKNTGDMSENEKNCILYRKGEK